MDKVKKEIDELTAQKAWKMSDEVFEKVMVHFDEVDGLEKRMVDLKSEVKKLHQIAKSAHEKGWQKIHELMPEIPNDMHLEFDKDDKIVQQCTSCLSHSKPIQIFGNLLKIIHSSIEDDKDDGTE